MNRRDICEVFIESIVHMDAARVSLLSRVFNVRLSVQLRGRWGDPRRLAEYMERLVGPTLQAWFDLRVRDGRAMAQSMVPHWEREITLAMEEMERRDRYSHEFRYVYQTIRPELFFGYGKSLREDPKAKKKATELLVKNLNIKQKAEYEKSKSFTVKGQDGKDYVISTARSFNVKGPDGTKYCGQLVDTPVEDQMLAQKLLLEHEPNKFFKNANVMGGPAESGMG